MRRKVPFVRPEPAQPHAAPQKGRSATSQQRRGQSPSFVMARPFVDNILAPAPPVQLSLFEGFSDKTKETLRTALGTDSDRVVAELVNRKGEGIILTDGEARLFDCLGRMLKMQSSETYNAKKPGYYLGATPSTLEIRTDGGVIHMVSAVVEFTYYSLAKMYNDDKNPQGSVMRDLKRIMENLDQNPDKRFLLKYPGRVTKDGKVVTVEHLTRYSPLLRIIADEAQQVSVNDETGELLEMKKIVRVELTPLFTEFGSGFIPMREDAARRLSGGRRQDTQATDWALYRWLARAHSHSPKDWVTEANEESLLASICKKEFQAKRWKLMREKLAKAIPKVKATGILLDAERVQGAAGQPKWVFTLNPDWLYEESPTDE